MYFWPVHQYFLGKSTILQNAFVMYVMKLRIHHILQCHFVIQKIQYILLKKKRGLLLNMTISLDTGLLPGHCSSLPKRSERRKALYKSEERVETSRNLSDQTFCNTCIQCKSSIRNVKARWLNNAIHFFLTLLSGDWLSWLSKFEWCCVI